MDSRDILRLLRVRWRTIVVAVLVGLALAAVYTLTQPKQYTSTSSGFVGILKQNESSSENQNLAVQGTMNDTLGKSRAKSYMDIAQTRGTANAVIKQLNLEETPDALLSKVTVEQPTDTVLLRVTVNADSPKEAQKLADAWVKAMADEVAKIEPSGPNAMGIRPLESANLPSSPSSPNPPRNLLLGGVLGLLVGFGVAAVQQQLDRRVRDKESIQKEFGAPVVATIPKSRNLARQGKDETIIPIVVGNNRTPDTTEAILKLRTNLQYTDVDNPPRVVVVTSPAQGDGKSTVSTNLAASLAAAGERVVLIDADLRRPVIAGGFGLPEGAGLTDVLAHRADVEDVLQEIPEVPGLFVLGAGSIPPNPSELLGSKSMARVIEGLRSRALVVIDAPPLLPVTDAAVLSTVSDGAFIVITEGRTMEPHLRHAVESVRGVGGKVLGVVMNRASRTSSGYGYRKGYGYGYGYGYTQDEAGSRRERRKKGRRSAKKN